MSNQSVISAETQKSYFKLHQSEIWPFDISIMHGENIFAELAWSVDTSWKAKEDANAEIENAETLRLANAMIATNG